MKKSGIDHLYIYLDRHIKLVQGYTEIPELPFIIKSCRLKPYEYVFGGTRKLVLMRKWFDEFGCTLNLVGKTPIITRNDLSIDRSKLICTDLYYGLPIPKIAKMSKAVHICAGIDEDKFEETYFLTFLGIDNYLRSYLYLWGEWEVVSPLLLGMRVLTFIARDVETKPVIQKETYKMFPMACARGQSYLCCLPMKSVFLEKICKRHEVLGEIFR